MGAGNRKPKSIAKARADWRKSIKGSGAYTTKEYKRRIAVHEDTLAKYLGQFGKWLGVWASRRPANARLAQGVFGLDRFEEVLSGSSDPAVSEVLRLAQARDFWPDFQRYLLGKTHLSYELGKKPSPKAPERNEHMGPYHDKLGEFVYIILAEFVVLHNYCFVGKLKGGRMETVDKWMKPAGKGAR